LVETNDPISGCVEPERCAVGNKGLVLRSKNQPTCGHLPESNPGINRHIHGDEVAPYHLLSHTPHEAQEHLAISGDRNRVSHSGSPGAYCANCVPGPGIKYLQCRPEESARHAASGNNQIIFCKEDASACRKAPLPLFLCLELGGELPRNDIVNKQIGWIGSFRVFQIACAG
jgi:hypothetical protein